MKIEIDQTDFREINDKLGGIKSAAVMARMTTEKEMITHLKNIVTWAQEITVRLNSGVMVREDGGKPFPYFVRLNSGVMTK